MMNGECVYVCLCVFFCAYVYFYVCVCGMASVCRGESERAEGVWVVVCVVVAGWSLSLCEKTMDDGPEGEDCLSDPN